MNGSINIEVPTIMQVTIFFDQKGFGLKDAETFFKEYSDRNWKGKKGVLEKNWRSKALDWMRRRQRERSYLRSKSKPMIP